MSLTQTNPTNVTPPYANRNNQGQKRPVFYVKFAQIIGPLGTNSQIVPYQFCTGPIKNPTMSRYRYMSTPTQAPNTISLISYQANVSQITFALQDLNDVVTTMVTNYPMKNRLVYIYKGYEDMDEQYYITVYVGQVNDWIMSSDGTQYIFTITDPQKQLTTNILKGHSQLTADFNPGDQTVYLTTSFYFPQATDLQDGNGPRNYVKINDALFSYTGNASGIIVDEFVTWTYIGHGQVTATTPQWQAGYGYQTEGSTLQWAFVGPITNQLTAPIWVANTAYSFGTRVEANGNVYQCVVAGTSLLTGSGPSVNGYVIGNTVYNLGNVYRCVIAGASAAATFIDSGVTWKWVAVGVPTTSILQWVQSFGYAVNTQVYNLGNIYICIIGGTSSSTSSGPSGIAQGPSGYGSPASALFGIQQVILNGNGSTPTQVHQAGSAVDNYILFQGNPITLMLQIIMSTGTGTNWSGTGTNYDVLPASQGIGVPWYLVNTANFVSQQGTYFSWMIFSGYFTEQVTALQFFQENFFMQCQLFTFTNKSGQLDMKAVYFALPTNNYTQIDDTNIIGIPQFDASLQSGNNFANEVDILWDYQPIADYYVNEAIFINNASQETYEESAIQEIDCQFIQTRFNGINIVKRISNIMLNLYGNPLPIITAKCISQLQTVNPGDTVLLASSQTPNLFTGQRGGTVICLCIAAAPDFTNDQCTLTLYATGYASNNKYAVIGPAGLPSYTNATPAQQNYNFISQLVPGNPSEGFMSNGQPGHYIPG